MFRKIVSGLPFSPALVGQLGFYAKRLRQEEATRRLGLVFTALAVIIQSFAVFSPPEAANAANDSDFIRGGINSLNDFLAAYDNSARGQGDIKNIMDYAGVTRDEIASAKGGSLNSKQFGTGAGAALSWGRVPRFSSDQGEVKHVVSTSHAASTVYSRPLWRYDSTPHTIKNGSSYEAYIGYSTKVGWFAILKDCGNLVTTKTPQPAPSGGVTATCAAVTGYAYDARQLSQKVKVYLYFGGPAGKGERYGPIEADQSKPTSPMGGGYGYSFQVPDKYKSSLKTTRVYAVMIPLAGWTDSSVQIGSAEVPADCSEPAYTTQPQPAASCSGISIQHISRTIKTVSAQAVVENGAAINGYTYIFKDSTGKVITQDKITTSDVSFTSINIDLKNTGDYSVEVIAHTSLGDKKGVVCSTTINIPSPEKCIFNQSLVKNHIDCQSCPGDSTLWIKHEKCDSHVIKGKTVTNLTQHINDANNSTAISGDRIEYSVFVENTGIIPAKVNVSEELSDVLEYATINDMGGATFDEESKTLSWGEITINPNEKVTRKFVVQIASSIAATPRGISEPGSYDCIMTNTFGNSTSLKVECPVVKSVELTVQQLPKTGPTANVIFTAALISIVTYFYARSRQLSKEIKMIRKELNTGSL